MGGERNLGLIETNVRASDGKRVLWVQIADGLVHDLPASGVPPVIVGVANDGGRVIVVGDESGVSQDIQPNAIGLSKKAFESIKYIFLK